MTWVWYVVYGIYVFQYVSCVGIVVGIAVSCLVVCCARFRR